MCVDDNKEHVSQCESLMCFLTVKREEISDTLTIHVKYSLWVTSAQRHRDYEHTLKDLMRRSRVFELFCALVCFLCSLLVVKKGSLGAGLRTD